MEFHRTGLYYKFSLIVLLLLTFYTCAFAQGMGCTYTKNTDGTCTLVRPDGSALIYQRFHPGANKVVDTFTVQGADGTFEMFFREQEQQSDRKLQAKSVTANIEPVKMTNDDGTVTVFAIEYPECDCEVDTTIVEQPDGNYIHYYTIRNGNRNILKKELLASAGKKMESVEVYENADEMPRYRNGKADLVNYIKKNIRFRNTGKRYVGSHNISFIVMKNGKIANIKMDEEYTIPPAALQKEIIRVLKSMPVWKPGKVNGKPANVYYTLQMNLIL